MGFFMMQHKNILINIAFQKADEAVESARASIKDGFLSTLKIGFTMQYFIQ